MGGYTFGLKTSLVENWYGWLRELRQRGMLTGQEDYWRFVVLCAPRTGSTMLRSLLHGHPSVVMFNELLNRETRGINFGVSGFRKKATALKPKRNENPVRFLEEDVFVPFSRRIKAVGFKVVYDHLNLFQGSPVLEYLTGRPDYQIIHLKRRNMLETLTSHELARQTDIWHSDGAPRDYRAQPIRVRPEHAQEFFERTQSREEMVERLFAHHPREEVYYEDLVRDPVREMDRLFRALELPVAVAPPKTKKLNKGTLTEKIENFQELREHFAGSPWERFFES